MFALKRTSLGSVLDCVAPCLEESLMSLAKLRLDFFFVPMPCALKAQTVIKTFCLYLAIPTCWRIGEKESKVSLENKATQTKHKPKPTQKDT